MLPTFTSVNLLLQREDPTIHLIADATKEFLKKLLSKYVQLQAIADVENITDVDIISSNHLSHSQVTIGFVTRNRLQHLLDAGDITNNDQKKFFHGVMAFFTDVTAQALKKFPFSDVINNARFLNLTIRMDSCARYSSFLGLTPQQLDQLQEEFVNY